MITLFLGNVKITNWKIFSKTRRMADENKGKKLPQFIAAVCVCIGALGTGTVIGWSANITDKLKEGQLNDLIMDEDDLGWAASTMTLGAMAMCFPIGWIADAIGRKLTVLLTFFPFVIGWLLITFTKHVAMLYSGRVLTGIAGGSFCVIAPLYTSEIAQTEIRGTLATFFQLFITIGILYAQVFGYAVPLTVYHFFLLGVPIVFGILFMFQPETPVYLLRKGKTEKVPSIFKRLRGKDYDPSAEIKAAEEQIAQELALPKFVESIKTKAAKKATLICFMLMFYQQLSGINAVMFYANEIFTSAGSTLPPHWCVITVGIVQVVATVFSAWLIEKVGRKILLIASCFFMGVACGLLGLFFSLKNNAVLDEQGILNIGFLPITSLVLFIIAFSIGLGPIPWVASSEIFPTGIKAKCSSAAATFNWFLAFLVTRFYLNIATAIGTDVTFYIFALIMATGIVFVLFVIPETKGTFVQLFITIGILYAQVFGYAVPLMVYHFFLLGVPIVFGILFMFKPETPFYLLRKGKTEKVPTIFKRLRGKDYDPSAEIKAAEEQTAKEVELPKFLESIKTKAAKKAAMICFILMFYQQFSGINAVMFYANEIFTSAGSTLPPHWCVITIGIVQVVATVFSSWLVDKVGRKILLIASCFFMGVACGLLGLFFSLKDNAVLDEQGIMKIGFLPITSLVLFIIAFSIGLGPIPFVALAEIFPTGIKAKCTSAAITFNWFLAFLVTRFYLNIATAIGTDVTFYIFALIMASGIAFVLFVIPETKGKTFAQIQADLVGTEG